jgi:hypothetical protein
MGDIIRMKVNFFGDEIDVVRDRDLPRASLKSICDKLGISLIQQVSQLYDQNWADLKEINGIVYISIVDLEMWLARLKPEDVLPHFRDALSRYVKHCAKTLHEALYPQKQIAVSSDPILAGLEAMVLMRKEQIAQQEQIEKIGGDVSKALAIAHAAAREAGVDPDRSSIASYINWKNKKYNLNNKEASAHGKAIATTCRARKIDYTSFDVSHEKYRAVHTYPNFILDEYFGIPFGSGKAYLETMKNLGEE